MKLEAPSLPRSTRPSSSQEDTPVSPLRPPSIRPPQQRSRRLSPEGWTRSRRPSRPAARPGLRRRQNLLHRCRADRVKLLTERPLLPPLLTPLRCLFRSASPTSLGNDPSPFGRSFGLPALPPPLLTLLPPSLPRRHCTNRRTPSGRNAPSSPSSRQPTLLLLYHPSTLCWALEC